MSLGRGVWRDWTRLVFAALERILTPVSNDETRLTSGIADQPLPLLFIARGTAGYRRGLTAQRRFLSPVGGVAALWLPSTVGSTLQWSAN